MLSAVQLFKKTKTRKAVDVLIEVLDSGSKYLRAEAAAALGEIKDPRAVKPLIDVLEDTDPEVRSRAERALRKMPTGGHPEVKEALKKQRDEEE